jgi:hypothetical protein
MSNIDNMVESWAKGMKGAVREDANQTPEGFKDWSLTKPKTGFVSANRIDPAGDLCAKDVLAGTPLDAAHAVREAVGAKKGRRPKVDSWKPVAAEVLGFKRLSAKRWQEVLDTGIDAGLFRIDPDALSFPILVVLDLPEPEPEPEPEVVRPSARAEAKDDDDFDYERFKDWPPEGYVSPVTFRCGHVNHKGHGVTEDDPKQVDAREEGYCCEAQREANVNFHLLNPIAVRSREAPLYTDWRVRGLYEAVPMSQRRTFEKETDPGWPGLCCDPKTGFYIGGLGNNCRSHHKDKERCVVHAPRKRGDK